MEVRDRGSALLGLCQTQFMFAQTLYQLLLPYLKWEDPPAPTARHILKKAVEELSHCTGTGDISGEVFSAGGAGQMMNHSDSVGGMCFRQAPVSIPWHSCLCRAPLLSPKSL